MVHDFHASSTEGLDHEVAPQHLAHDMTDKLTDELVRLREDLSRMAASFTQVMSQTTEQATAQTKEALGATVQSVRDVYPCVTADMKRVENGIKDMGQDMGARLERHPIAALAAVGVAGLLIGLLTRPK